MKVFIQVRGGMIQHIQSTSKDIEISVFDYDNFDPLDNESSGWQYWKSKGGDEIMNDKKIEASMKKVEESMSEEKN